MLIKHVPAIIMTKPAVKMSVFLIEIYFLTILNITICGFIERFLKKMQKAPLGFRIFKILFQSFD